MQIQTKEKRKNGFTLVEMIVVLGVMGILFALSVPAEVNYNKRAVVKSTAKEIRSLFWDAQNRSLAPRTKDAFAYEVGVIKQNQPGVLVFNNKECESLTSCSEFDGGYSVKMPVKNVYIKEINKYTLGVSSPIDSIAVFFSVGGNKNSGVMNIYNTVSGIPICTDLVPCNKIEIVIASKAIADYEYKVILNKSNNSITYELNY